MGNHQVWANIERADGPALIAHVFNEKLMHEETPWHTHVRGQFIYIDSGVVRLRTRFGDWTLPPHRVGWMPPGEEHTVRVDVVSRGWGVFVAPQAACDLPERPCVLGDNPLMRELVYRASSWAFEDALVPEQQRVLAVLMDEIRRAPSEPLSLPMPSDRRLARVTQALLIEPGDNRSLDDWAQQAGLSARTMTRLFRQETGCSFGQWRQQARLTRAVQWLAAGRAVSDIAIDLGYESVSAFVAMFRRHFGMAPGRYVRGLGPHAPLHAFGSVSVEEALPA
ncbi:helix-turn-helix transcriptional regulator [Oleiagrimonas sp. C23AA]|uniref:helix-turn-helix domain-containing protein n=1 Tax=Oleiagrimonas sp. C23AA TaxID=2719047 RepID=UPI00141E3A5F|nr:helix-turn-helix transcriptional regulator [Oleiagrimonas sp. C23AA]NII11323.1 AraC family transcriptional regulator [Oleiagrimonas sp. C23AA]